MNKPLVWQLLDSRDIGGIESHCATLKETMDPIADVQIRLLCEYGPHPSLSAYGAKALSPGLIRAYLDEKPVAIHTHGYKATLLARTLLRPLGARLCTTYHAGETLKGKMAFYGWLQKHTGFLSQQNFAVNPKLARQAGWGSQVLDNFIAPQALTLAGKQIAFAGRLSEEKGHDRLPEIAASLGQVIDVYGDGDRCGLEGKALINLHGAVSSMTPHWENIGVLIMPSRHEGLPMAALEAISRGIPVVASDVGALNQIVANPDCGELVTQYQPEAFAQAILSVLNRRSLGQSSQCRAHCEARFSPARALTRLRQAYGLQRLEESYA